MTAFDEAKSIIARLNQRGHVAYFAGGWVRDFLLKRESDDIDIATDAPPEIVQALFPDSVPIGLAFGIILVLKGGHQFEVATFRRDISYKDGRHPTQVEFTTPIDDAKRRDFTVNGMFYDPFAEKILDFVGGQKDLKAKIIRAIGDPHARFKEDRLRMIRAARLACKLDFRIEEETKQAVQECAKELFPSVAIERVWKELSKIASAKGFLLLHALKLLEVIFPSLSGIQKEELEKKLLFIEHLPKETPAIIKILELFPNYNMEEGVELCHYFKLSNQEINVVNLLYKVKDRIKDENSTLYDWAYLYAEKDCELILCIVAAHLRERDKFLQEHTKRKELLQSFILRIQEKRPVVRAEDLQKLGVKPGKQMGILLKEAEKIAINNLIDNTDLVIEELKGFLR